MTSNTSVYIEQLKNHTAQEVTLSGWLYNSRGGGKVLFLIVRDGTGLCQCVVEKGKVSDELFEQLKHLGQESSLTVTGTVRAEERSVGGYELAVANGRFLNGGAIYRLEDGTAIEETAGCLLAQDEGMAEGLLVV